MDLGAEAIPKVWVSAPANARPEGLEMTETEDRGSLAGLYLEGRWTPEQTTALRTADLSAQWTIWLNYILLLYTISLCKFYKLLNGGGEGVAEANE